MFISELLHNYFTFERKLIFLKYIKMIIIFYMNEDCNFSYVIVFIWQHLVSDLHISIWRTADLQRRFVRYLSFAHNVRHQDPLRRTSWHCLGRIQCLCLHNPSDFNLPPIRDAQATLEEYTLTDFDTQTLATSVTRPRRDYLSIRINHFPGRLLQNNLRKYFATYETKRRERRWRYIRMKWQRNNRQKVQRFLRIVRY